MTLRLYGHPFSSYTWKALIPLYAHGVAFEFRNLETGTQEDFTVVGQAGPLGKFPVLVAGDRTIFEATTIIEYLALHHLPHAGLIPTDAGEALEIRKMDRVFDNYVMNVMNEAVVEAIRKQGQPDPGDLAEVRARLERVYGWLDNWLADYERPSQITLVECAGAPSLFYADWVHQITEAWPRLKEWRAHLLDLPAVSRCVEDARPFRPNFPLGAPDRD